jgi:hypothetical protein
MYDIIAGIVDHSWTTGTSEQQYIYYTCCVIIPILTIILADSVRFVFRAFLGRRK